ncbi:SLOG domain-containing protein [Empedobacter falsenii]|uniref:Uncharacterized protein n=1 Tax=Empedobacter falsenii TaxID=343874 RepID=A0A3R8TJ98_9FLAO|nr:hypothetical protein [Empedobacter falsenii]RRT86400.1 hypothetical protein EGI88_14670 [Empedobacter falsenii]RRT87464.1 hypothetical protein EGI89_14640 [Empedobacter falsenii]
MKNIFLSASIPLPERHPKYYDTADIIAIRDSVIALASIVIDKHRIIWGGHPSITPLINFVIERTVQYRIDKSANNMSSEEQREYLFQEIKREIQNHVIIYQSEFFRDKFPEDNDKFENIVFTDNKGDIHSSIQEMRQRMLSENEFAAAVFIGGMDGIEVEYKMFKEFHPKALILPIASTGAATKIVYDNLPEDDEPKHERYLKDYGYMSLFQKYLIDKI